MPTIRPLPASSSTDWYGHYSDVDAAARSSISASEAGEIARDALGAALVAGANVTITPNDAADTITISASVSGSSYSDEQAQDAMAALVAAGSHAGITFAYNDAGNALSATVAAPAWSAVTGKPSFSPVATSGSYVDLTDTPIIPASYSDEQAQDAMAALLLAGSHTGISFTYDDANDRINATVTVSGGSGSSYSDEQAQDAAATLVAAGTHYGISFSYNDAGNSLSATVTGLTKADVGLNNVNNTADSNKPVSTATQTALDAKADTSALTGHTGRTDNPHATTKAQVGLGAVDNTADTAKPVSTAQQTALDAKAAKASNLSDLASAATARTNLGVAYGTAAGTVAQGNDGRLSDTRTPTDGSVTDAKVAAGAGIALGKLAITGTASTTTYLRGDGSWATVTGAGAADLRGFGVYFASQYGVVGDGSDETTKLQNALAAVPNGGKLVLDGDGTATYGISAPLVVPPGRTLAGMHSSTLLYPGNATADPAAPCSIKVLAGFTGAAAIRLLGKTAGGYAAASSMGHRVENVTVNGSAGPANVAGVQVFGFVREATLRNVTCRRMTTHGFDLAPDPAATAEQSTSPQSLRLIGCVADNCTGAGFSIVNVPDTTIEDCNAQGSGWHGYYVAGMQNGIFEKCRSEFSGAQGWCITSGYWASGQGSGGVMLTSCLTDRSYYNGIFVDATGAHDVQLTGCRHRRDGRASTTGGYAGVFVDPAATMPVTVTGVSVKPGIEDNGTGNLTPQYGISATGTGVAVSVVSGEIHGVTAALNAGGRLFVASEGVKTAVGAPGSATRTDPVRLADRYANITHAHPVTDLTATGTRSASTFLRGDGTWATPAGGSGGSDAANAQTVYATAPPTGTAVAANGTTNDAPALQAQLTYVKNTWGGGRVTLPVGTIKCQAGLTIPAGVQLVGAGQSATTLDFSGAGTSTVAITSSGDRTTPIRALRLKGPNGGDKNAYPTNTCTGLICSGIGVTIRDVTVESFFYGIDLTSDNTFMWTGENLDLRYCGVALDMNQAASHNGGTVPSENGERMVLINSVVANSQVGFDARGSGVGFFATGCSFDYLGKEGVVVDAFVHITNCHLETGYSAANNNWGAMQRWMFDLSYEPRVTFTSCRFEVRDPGVYSAITPNTGPAKYNSGYARFDNCTWYGRITDTATTETQRQFNSRDMVSFPNDSTTQKTVYSPFATKWNPISARAVATDAGSTPPGWTVRIASSDVSSVAGNVPSQAVVLERVPPTGSATPYPAMWAVLEC